MFGSPKFVDGKFIVTSEVVGINGRNITTKSGTVYYLGKIDPKYRRFLKTNRPNWDWRNPISDLRNIDS